VTVWSEQEMLFGTACALMTLPASACVHATLDTRKLARARS